MTAVAEPLHSAQHIEGVPASSRYALAASGGLRDLSVAWRGALDRIGDLRVIRAL